MRNHILLALAVLPACSSATAPDRPAAVPLSLRVVPARATVMSGDTVTVRLTARNVGTVPVTIDNAYPTCVMSLRLRDARDEPHQTIVFRPFNTCMRGDPVTVAPGDSLVEVGRWEAGVLVGGDVLAHAEPGTWTLHPVVYTGGQALPGTLDVPATLTVTGR